MRLHPVTVVVVVYWFALVGLAALGSGASSAAGHLPESWVGPVMVLGVVNVGVVGAGAWFASDLPLPRIALRILQIIGMAGALWGTGTVARALYFATH